MNRMYTGSMVELQGIQRIWKLPRWAKLCALGIAVGCLLTLVVDFSWTRLFVGVAVGIVFLILPVKK